MLTLSLIGVVLAWLGASVYVYDHLPEWRRRATLADSKEESE